MLAFIATGLAIACTSEVVVEVTREIPVTREIDVEVTRELQVTRKVEVPVTIEVTRETEIEVTRELEVTRLVEVPVTVEVTREVDVEVTREVYVNAPDNPTPSTLSNTVGCAHPQFIAGFISDTTSQFITIQTNSDAGEIDLDGSGSHDLYIVVSNDGSVRVKDSFFGQSVAIQYSVASIDNTDDYPGEPDVEIFGVGFDVYDDTEVRLCPVLDQAMLS